MNGLLSDTTWHGLHAWMLENDTLRTIVLPDLGAKLVSLFDKRCQMEWLVDSGGRPLSKVNYGAVFTDQDLSGWDEMFPTITTCDYPAPGKHYGTHLPDHGEVWALPWKQESAPADELKLSVEGIALPYRLTRTLRYSSGDCLQMHYVLENLGGELLAYIWAAHPQFVSTDATQIYFPSQVQSVYNTADVSQGWGAPETCFDWPQASRLDGRSVRLDRTGPASLKQARKFYVPPDTHVDWSGIQQYSGGPWLQMQWDAEKVPFLGLWVDEGFLSHTTVVAPEPATGYYDSLAVAWLKKRVTIIEPNTTRNWILTVRLGESGQSFPAD